MDGKGESYTRSPTANYLQPFGHGKFGRSFSYKYRPLGSRIAINFLRENSAQIVGERTRKRHWRLKIQTVCDGVYSFQPEDLTVG
ncbi:hypothetical protein Bca4012_011203 [Brassica carinata]